MGLLTRINPYWLYIKLGAGLVVLVLAFGFGYYTARTAGLLVLQMERTRAEQVIGEFAKAERDAVQRARKAEQAAAAGIANAQDEADKRDDQIEADYARRVAGVAADRDQLRKHWAGCETDRLSEGAAAAAEVAQQDRLRRESAARVVRAAERAQSERDEVIDRYEAVRKSSEISR